jgi:hypothetical protein
VMNQFLAKSFLPSHVISWNDGALGIPSVAPPPVVVPDCA